MAAQRILITGGAGYIGSLLVRRLSAREDVRVRILDNLQREGHRALMELAPRKVEFIEGDILDPASVRRALQGADTVVHLAAVVRTPLSFEHPRWTEQVNSWGTARLVESCLEMGVSRFVFASSSSVYGPCEKADEHAPCRPMGPYAASKLAAERAISSAAERGLVPTILRMGVAFGSAPVTRFEAMPNRLAYLAALRRTLAVYGTGEQTRPLLHVSDACSSIAFCLERPEETAGATFNVVSSNSSVLDVVEALRAHVPDVRVWHTEQDIRTHLSFSLEGSRLKELGWRPGVGLEEGMGEITKLFEGVRTPPLEGAEELYSAELEFDE